MSRSPALLALAALLLTAPAVWAALPGDLAPSAPELQEAELRLQNLFATNDAVASATSRLQAAWALPPQTPADVQERIDASAKTAKPGADPSRTVKPHTAIAPSGADPCADEARLALGWRIERFGTAWRETAQAVRAAASRVKTTREAPTAYPLLDERWTARLNAQAVRAETAVRAWREASAWQTRFVRPVLQACPQPSLSPADGIEADVAWALGEEPPAVAVLALGEGLVCPDGQRAEDAVVILLGDTACWSATAPCACTPARVLPGAVLAEPPAPPEAPAEPSEAPEPPVKGSGPPG